jgi:acetylornithine aminotransferase
MQHASQLGEAWIQRLRSMSGILEVRGRGLMIGFGLPGEKSDLRNRLLNTHHIFTGEAKPNTIRLLPALSISEEEGMTFFVALNSELS